ncbi:hypothetical protein AQPE_1636 [Aquipluma nitroreducens]|uniref:Uncharacterized protein n=1 Tax=Aquipluma nitroreducens TaxID=2010828 RepID=A0A5K7S7H6_9BACT|nr:hypothetical protein [Aquipluma nitroreducens]BBE17486.1 hypothetical protein AQPE_1636 [Aquipluma nitroreducens]
MITVDLTQNFNQIYNALVKKGEKPTNIAKTIGYTTTTQLKTTLDGISQLSSKAIVNLIEKLNINPLYLFLGKGEIFLSESTEDELFKLNEEVVKLKKDLDQTISAGVNLVRRNTELEKMVANLSEMHAKTLRFYQSKPEEEESINDETEQN